MLEMLRRNLGVKTISLLFAILFWVFVMMNNGVASTQNYEQTTKIQVRYSGLPQNMVIMSELPSVSGRVLELNPSANISDIYAQIDLSGGVPGENTFKIEINAPTGTKVVDIQPANVKLMIDTVEEKTVPVEPIVSGDPAEGYQVGNTFVKPSAVNVRGPSSILGKLDKVTVEISASGANETIQVSRPVSFRDKEGKPIFGPDPSVNILSTYPSSVDVVAPVIVKGLSSKMVPLKVTSNGTPAQGKIISSLVASPASVMVLGTTQALKGFDSLNLGPVDISNLSEDKTFQIPNDKVSLPSGVKFREGTSLSVIARIGPGITQKTISGVAVQIRNIDTGLEVDQPVPPIDIVIEGLSDVLKNVTTDQIQLWVDATGQVAGSYTDAKVYWQLPPGVTIPATAPTVPPTTPPTTPTTPQVGYSLKAK